MRKLVVLSLVAGALALGLLVPRGTTAPALADKPGRWEYAELRYSARYVLAAPQPGQKGGAMVRRATVRWTTADEDIEGAEWDDLADKLKAPALKGEATPDRHKFRVLNRVGADGWEVYQQTGADGTTNLATYLFRRRVS